MDKSVLSSPSCALEDLGIGEELSKVLYLLRGSGVAEREGRLFKLCITARVCKRNRDIYVHTQISSYTLLYIQFYILCSTYSMYVHIYRQTYIRMYYTHTTQYIRMYVHVYVPCNIICHVLTECNVFTGTALV